MVVIVAEQVVFVGLMLLLLFLVDMEIREEREVLVLVGVDVRVGDEDDDGTGRRFGHMVVIFSVTVAFKPTSAQRDVVQFEIISTSPRQVQKPR